MNKRAESVKIQARDSANGASTITVKANQEIILCAGWLHTPQVLQRSGLGPRALLQQAGINVLVDLPGVGANLQDHPAISMAYNCELDILSHRCMALIILSLQIKQISPQILDRRIATPHFSNGQISSGSSVKAHSLWELEIPSPLSHFRSLAHPTRTQSPKHKVRMRLPIFHPPTQRRM